MWTKSHLNTAVMEHMAVKDDTYELFDHICKAISKINREIIWKILNGEHLPWTWSEKVQHQLLKIQRIWPSNAAVHVREIVKGNMLFVEVHLRQC